MLTIQPVKCFVYFYTHDSEFRAYIDKCHSDHVKPDLDIIKKLLSDKSFSLT